MAAHPGPPTWGTLPPYFDTPPIGQITTSNVGSSTTAPMAPVDPPDARRMPRHILRDPQMCHALTQNARHYVNNLGSPPGNLPFIHLATQMNLNAATGDEARNLDVFAHATGYIRHFVEIADDGLPADAVQSIPCEGHGGIQPNRKLRRQGIDRAIVEPKSVAAFNAHADPIQALGGANNNDGTPIIFGTTETNARSIVFKLGKHMIDTNCSWGLLLGGNDYMLFYVDRIVDHGETYYHIVVSDRHAAFPPAAPQGTPCLIQVAIALLLGDVGSIAYTPPTSTVSIAYVQGRRTTRLPRTSTGRKPSKTAPSRMRTRSQTTDGGRRGPGTGFDLLGGAPLCSLVYPRSDLPDREFALSRVDAQKAMAIMSGVVDDLPETAADSRGAHPLIDRAEGFGQLLALEMLGSGTFGFVYDSLCVINGREEKCATKVVQYQFHTFQAEISVYEQIGGRPFVPSFYGAFAGMWVTGPLGVLVMERIPRTFNSYDEMNAEEKHGALKCLEEFHEAGYHHGDVSARNFGARGSQFVILDFSNAGLYEACDPRTCYELRTLKEHLFGKGED